ncbi:MAG: DUF1189 domain-containing protein, partial [Bacilli bacterium]
MNIFKQFFYSLFSLKAMASFRFQKITKTIFYILLVCVISIIPISVVGLIGANDQVDFLKKEVRGQIPAFSIKNYQLESSLDTPWIRNSDIVYFAVDPKNEVKEVDIRDYAFSYVFQKEQVIIGTALGSEVIRYDALPSGLVSTKDLTEQVDTLIEMLPLVMPVTFLLLFIMRLFTTFVHAFLFGVSFYFLAKLMKRKLTYAQGFTIAAYALTIPLLFFSIMEGFGVPIIGDQYVFIAATLLVGG